MSSNPGLSMPGIPSHPTVRKRIPPAFQRPSVSVGAAEVRREWATVPASTLRVDDNLPGVGLITQIVTTTSQTPNTVVIYGLDGGQMTFSAEDEVFAFTASTGESV